MIPEFDNPHALWLMLVIPLYLLWLRRTRRTSAVRYPSVRQLKRLPRSLRLRLRFVLPLMLKLYALGAIALIVAVWIDYK